MDRVNRKDCPERIMPGRITRSAFGANGKVTTDDALMGFVTFSPKYGEMEPHYHDTEAMYVENAKDAYVRFGPSADNMNRREKLEKGEVICAEDGEWHKFEFDSPYGFVDLVIFMATPAPTVVNASDIK